MSRKVLILSSALGGGHQSAAGALTAIIHSRWPQVRITTADMSPPLGSSVYRFLSNYMTDVFVKNWHVFNNEASAKLLHLLSTPLVMAKLTPILKSSRPDLIIATHAFSTEEVTTTLKQLRLNIPLVVVVVDPFSIHHAWTSWQQADLYLLPTDFSYRLFVGRGFDPRRLLVTGQPLRPLPQLRQKRLDPKQLTIFLGGSGEGVGRIDQIVNKLLTYAKLLDCVRLIIACGKNRTLLAQMQALKQNYPQLIWPYGFTDKIFELVNSADLVVGKAGPNLMWETIALGKPILTTGLPLGQEAGNYRFIARGKLGLVTYSPQQTVKKLLQIIKQPELLKQFQPAIKKQQQLIRQTPPRILAGLRPFLQA